MSSRQVNFKAPEGDVERLEKAIENYNALVNYSDRKNKSGVLIDKVNQAADELEKEVADLKKKSK